MIVALDLETTGIDPKNDKIIEIALVKFDQKTFKILDTFSTLINPEIPIPAIASSITNIYDTDVQDAPIFDTDMQQKVVDFIGGSPILGHNIDFDSSFLQANGIPLSQTIHLDTFGLARILFFDHKTLNLGSLCEYFKIPLLDAHRALDDTKATVSLFEAISKYLKKLPKYKKQLLGYIFSHSLEAPYSWYNEYYELESDISSEIFTKTLLRRLKKLTPPAAPSSGKKHYTAKELLSSLPEIEPRENQSRMIDIISEGMNSDTHQIIEAPTGIGKTFAYLLPALEQHQKTRHQVVIATHTKTLQDQIFYKDLAFLETHLPIDFSYTKIKGKKNYVSLQKYFAYFEDHNVLDTQEVLFLSKLALWMIESEFGELEEVFFYPQESYLVKEVSSETSTLNEKQNLFYYDEFLYKAHQKCKNADIIITNHAFLLQNNTGGGVLQDIQYLIIDEAHNLEDSTTDALERGFSMPELWDTLQKIKTLGEKHKIDSEPQFLALQELGETIHLLFDVLQSHFDEKNSGMYFSPKILLDASWYDNHSHEISSYVSTINTHFQTSKEAFLTLDKKLYAQFDPLLQNILEYVEIVSICSNVNSGKDYICMFAKNPQDTYSLSYTILSPGDFLQNHIWNTIPYVLLTSATLQIGGDFGYISQMLGSKEFETHILESDFDYKKQVTILVPNDLGSTRYDNPMISQFLLDFFSIVGGKSLVLFTSFSSIKQNYLYMIDELKSKNISLLAQGVAGSKYRIFETFTQHSQNSILFGTSSFWEGVDFPHGALKYLFIHKFPFQVPSDPIFQARSGGFQDAFGSYSIPKAILKTKQGFGRLIRSKKDLGVVVLLDERIFSTLWGEKMKDAFPPDAQIKQVSSQNILDVLTQKYN